MKAYATTHIGLVRSINQDAFYLPKLGEDFAIVADGMGGHLAGEVASGAAVEEVSRWLRCAPRPNEDAILHAVSEANLRIYHESRNDPHKSGMGTTLTALWYSDDYAYLAHVGDSRAYLFRQNVLMRISRDHSVVGEMVERGQLTPEEALVHPQRHYITRALGADPQVQPDVTRFSVRSGDIWLLCSDGLTNHVRENEIAEFLQHNADWSETLQMMVQRALERGGSDNITVVVVTGGDAV